METNKETWDESELDPRVREQLDRVKQFTATQQDRSTTNVLEEVRKEIRRLYGSVKLR